ncbi:chromatin assembly factor 1 subunit p50 [Monosporozyma unispora]|nr:hypothetical protein C6P44_005256 [Kazachstania unispora]
MEGETVKSEIDADLQLRYSHWKKNTKLLYDYLNTNTSKWPSLTCQFFPDIDTSSDTHRLLLSSFTSGQLPEDENVYIANLSTLKHVNWANLNNFDMNELEFKPDNSIKFPPKHLTTNLTIKFPLGDCNRARYMPQNPDVIAAASSSGDIYVFDRTKHGSRRLRKSLHDLDNQDGDGNNIIENAHYEAKFKDDDGNNDNKIVIDNIENINDNEAVSISWNLQKEGTLVAAYSKGSIKTWDLKKFNVKDKNIHKPKWNITTFDSEGCNDVNWMPLHDSIFAAAGESTNSLALFDTRTQRETSKIRSGFHNTGINACKFNYGNNMLLASADNDGMINLWDIRNLDEIPIMTLNHESSVSTIEWNPNEHFVLASAGQQDGLVKLWDISQEDKLEEDNSSSKLIFVHAGHMLGVNDLSWDLHDPWLISSVSNDNSIHIWKPAANIVQPA